MILRSLFTFMFLASSLHAAAPMVHVYIADKWIESFETYNEEERGSFILGTLFPDIRYLGVLSRKTTHDENVSLESLLETENPFMKGKLLHSFVDETRARIVQETKILDYLSEIPKEHRIVFLKFLEDEVVYSQKNWSALSPYLSKIDENESSYLISTSKLNQWHYVLGYYFKQKPSVLFKQLGFVGMGLLNISAKDLWTWAKLLPILAKEEPVLGYVNYLLEEFDQRFEWLEHPILQD